MKKIIGICILSIFSYGASLQECLSLGDPASIKSCKAQYKESNRIDRINQFKMIESKSHQGRIAILNKAENCINVAKTREEYKACESIEKNERKRLREQTKNERKELRGERRN